MSAAAARATTRHSALRHRLPHTETANATTATWIRDRVALYARTAGLQIPHIAVTPGELQARLGRRSPRRPHLAGWADWTQRPGTVLVDLAQLPTLAAADLVCAHEVAHLLLQRTGHPPGAVHRRPAPHRHRRRPRRPHRPCRPRAGGRPLPQQALRGPP